MTNEKNPLEEPEIIAKEISPENLSEEGETSVAQVAEEIKSEDIVALKQELEEIRQKSEEYLEGWQRERAEFANYRKRIEKEREQIHQNAAGAIIRRYLEILDDLERALKDRPQSGDGAAWAEGIELIYRKLLAILESEGVKPMQVEGQFFDPNLHEAVSQEESPEHESGQIIEVVQNGYWLGDRVLRPALVRVAR